MHLQRQLVSGMSLVAVALLAGVTMPATAAESYKIDSVHSVVMFRVKHYGVSHFYGRFNEFSGAFELDAEDSSKSSVSFEVKTESIDTKVEKRDQHLRSPDFFNANQFPTISFQSTAVKQGEEGQYEVTGNLTMHGVTKEVTLSMKKVGEGEDPRGGYRIGFEGGVEINRSEFGVNTFDQGAPGALSDEVKIKLSIEAVRQS